MITIFTIVFFCALIFQCQKYCISKNKLQNSLKISSKFCKKNNFFFFCVNASLSNVINAFLKYKHANNFIFFRKENFKFKISLISQRRLRFEKRWRDYCCCCFNFRMLFKSSRRRKRDEILLSRRRCRDYCHEIIDHEYLNNKFFFVFFFIIDHLQISLRKLAMS